MAVAPGVELTPTQSQAFPDLVWPEHESAALYTVMLVDPDAPSPTDRKYCCWLHFLKTNVPCGALDAGDEVAAFVSPAPGNGAGAHRYVWLVYRQKAPLKDIVINDMTHIAVSSGFAARRSFDPSAFQGKAPVRGLSTAWCAILSDVSVALHYFAVQQS